MRWSILISPQSLEIAGQAALLSGWIAGAAWANHYSGLSERARAWANVACLLLGPLAWPAHLAPRVYRWWRDRNSISDAEGFARAAQAIMIAALEGGASDIHIEAQGRDYIVRFRQVGLLREHRRFDLRSGQSLIAVYKVLAELNTAEKNLLQDGRFSWTDPKTGHVLDVRISTSPALAGEKVALRLLNRPASLLRLETLGISQASLEAMRRHLRQPEGLVLVAGPTGSGKTSTSYAVLQEVSGPSVNTVTIEDPVEYCLPHATQIGINPKLGVTFESSLRTVLRQDPNIIFVGEMRDPESFGIGVRAAMSGHLVISTMHARDTVGALTALRNLKLDRQVLSAAVRMVISQRLMRELCPHCREWVPADAELRDFFQRHAGTETVTVPERMAQPSHRGCAHCHEGFVGRVGVFEVLRITPRARAWISDGGAEAELRDALRADGFETMHDDARAKLAAGRVWIDDAIRALGMENE